jgi:prepilin-type N-terminal cleavage/methylation domain-containing protein
MGTYILRRSSHISEKRFKGEVMRKGFTMVEVIFAIVIIGILSDVAIPRLSATRDDAINSRDCKNTAVCITDLVAEYTAKGTATKDNSKACRSVESSSKNDIVVNVNMSKKIITVNGLPEQCSNLGESLYFGGSRISY